MSIGTLVLAAILIFCAILILAAAVDAALNAIIEFLEDKHLDWVIDLIEWLDNNAGAWWDAENNRFRIASWLWDNIKYVISQYIIGYSVYDRWTGKKYYYGIVGLIDYIADQITGFLLKYKIATIDIMAARAIAAIMLILAVIGAIWAISKVVS